MMQLLFICFLFFNILLCSTCYAATLSTSARQVSCTTVANCGTDEYCAGSTTDTTGTCTSIDYSDIVTLSTPPANTNAFTLIMATDVQFEFLTCKQEPLSECVFDGVAGRTNRLNLLKDATTRQVACIDHLTTSVYSDVKAIFDLGDITNSGFAGELTDYKTYFHTPVSALSPPSIIVLGNHDYNVFYDPKSRKRMINFLEGEIDELANSLDIRNIDFQTTPITEWDVARQKFVKFTKGSFCYSVEINGNIFIMMHWAAAINGGEFVDAFEVEDDDGNYEVFDITSADTWIRDELASAMSENKPVFLLPHSRRGLEKFITSTRMGNLLSRSTVEAVICGHDHDQWGYFGDITVGNTSPRDIPVYYAGSASYEKLIAVKFKSGGGLADTDPVIPYDSSVGPCVVTTADNIEYTPTPSP